MTRADRGILEFESTLRPEVRERLTQIAPADVLIGIPSHRNGRTIGEVVQAVSTAISQHLAGERVVLLNTDGGSSDNTTHFITELAVPANVEKVTTVYTGAMGKGTAVRAVFEAAALLRVRACMVVEARAHGISAEWIPALVGPVLDGTEMTTATYQRSAYAAALTDNLAFPFVNLLFDTNLREPLPSEFCVSGDLAADLAGRDVWETDVARFGVNAWLSTSMLAENRRIAQVELGYRGEGGGEPGQPLDAHFLHITGTLFRMLTTHRRLWLKDVPSRHLPFSGERALDRLVPCRECVPTLVGAMRSGKAHYAAEWRRVLSPRTLRALAALFERTSDVPEFPDALWARVVTEFALVYNKGEGDPDKVVEALLPLYYGRTAAFVVRTAGLSVAAREALVRQLAQAFTDLRPFFLEQWRGYEPWVDTSQ